MSPSCRMLGGIHPQLMKISEGNDNLIKCNRIPSESVMGESLGYLTIVTFCDSKTNRICSFCVIVMESVGKKKNVLHTSGKNKEKHYRLLETYFYMNSHHEKGKQSYTFLSSILQKVSVICGCKQPILQC